MAQVLLVDAGGVLFNNINEETSFVARLAARHGADPGRLLQTIFSTAHQYESGARGAHTVMREALVDSGAWSVRSYDAQWVDRLYLDSLRCYRPNLQALAEVLRANPSLTAVLANNEAEHWDELKNAHFGHYQHFDRLCSSWRVGQVKPSQEYFAAVLERCETEPVQALMVDDRTAVVEVAQAMGMRTLHVRTPEVLCGSLRATVDDLLRPVRTR
ncbi:HAD family hydrolase [Parafrankia discariae]|uniref:HAD family hydrolase n=1 Tax=Parafrankia discariae TaxID=365528 RepID=UPI00036F6F13|nr:HAD-IA family hydrolase [Parafrankia discariae]